MIKASFSDYFALLDGCNKFIEFKTVIRRKIIRRLNEVNKIVGIGFLAMDSIDRKERRILSSHSELELFESFE